MSRLLAAEAAPFGYRLAGRGLAFDAPVGGFRGQSQVGVVIDLTDGLLYHGPAAEAARFRDRYAARCRLEGLHAEADATTLLLFDAGPRQVGVLNRMLRQDGFAAGAAARIRGLHRPRGVTSD